MIAHCASRVFTGHQWLQHHAVLVNEEGLVVSVIPEAHIPAGVSIKKYIPGSSLVPSFIDLQIYGAGGRLLAAFPDAQSLQALVDYCRKGGAAWCMPTVATHSYEVFYQCIDAVRRYWADGGKGVLGLHIEGPWFHPLRKGAHVESFIHSPTPAQAKALLEYGKGVIRIITLAPDCVSQEVMDLVKSYGVIISAGHSNATYEQARQSFGSGVTAVTHLYNAMSPLQHRAPGLVGAAMDDDQVMVSIIPDGYHVDYAAIRIAKAVIKDRLFVITDAVTETHTGYYQHYRAGDKYEANGTLSGSALTMIQAVHNLVQHCGIEEAEAIRMCSLYPARTLGQTGITGEIKAGEKAGMLLLDATLQVIELID